MKFNASQIAMMLQGQLVGDDVVVDSLSKIEEGKKGSLSFLSNPKYTPFIYQTEASVVIVNEDFAAQDVMIFLSSLAEDVDTENLEDSRKSIDRRADGAGLQNQRPHGEGA